MTTATDYADAMTKLGCNTREHGRNGRDNGGIYCATHNESVIYDGPEVRGVCRKAYNVANGICGHAICKPHPACLLASN